MHKLLFTIVLSGIIHGCKSDNEFCNEYGNITIGTHSLYRVVSSDGHEYYTDNSKTILHSPECYICETKRMHEIARAILYTK